MASFQWAPTAISTASTSAVMGGLGAQAGAVAIVPAATGIVVVTIDGDLYNANANDQVKVQIRYGSGTAPAAGAAATSGTASGPTVVTDGATGRFPFSFTRRIGGLTIGTSYWYDVAFFCDAGTANLEGMVVTGHELAS